jgi:two-component sensor histidine kinase
VRISPKSTIALAMALQELAANSSTRGALSAPEGRVELDWKMDRDKVALEWREIGGPPASPPAASGFAAFLLGRMLSADLGEPAQMIQAPEGLICRIRAPTMPACAGLV